MKISVFGTGYVGVVSSACLSALGHDVVGVDIVPEKVAMLNRGESPIIESGLTELVSMSVAAGRLSATHSVGEAVRNSDISFISVGTPSSADGSASTSALADVMGSIGEEIRTKATPHIVVIRSTIPPSTSEERFIPLLEQASHRKVGDDLSFYVNPEFLREGTAIQDFRNPPFTLIGAPPGDNAVSLRALYASLQSPLFVTPIRVAESVKYLSNTYHALKLAFANEAGAILSECGADARAAFEIFCKDRQLNISPAYLRPGYAFGGSCLPKDVRAFTALADTLSIQAPLLKSVLTSNEQVVDRAFAAITKKGRAPISMFGLAFKSGTDDLRESPYVTLAERLIGRGYDLRIFDERVDMARLIGQNRRYIEREIPHLGRLLVSSPKLALDHAQIVVIGHITRSYLPSILNSLNGQTVIDLFGLPELETHPAIRYYGLCW
jgi:GDP-mannose 6-dehydrogenase